MDYVGQTEAGALLQQEMCLCLKDLPVGFVLSVRYKA